MSCQECTRKAECDKYNKSRSDKTCLVLELLLPGKREGTGYREKNAGFLTINNNSAYKPSVTTRLREAIGNFVFGQNHPGHLPRIFKVSQYLITLKMSTNPMHDEKLFNEKEKWEPKCSETF
jgi:hypothetical protein